MFLADFKQIKKIQCLCQGDGKALLKLDVEGARQVSTRTPQCTVTQYYIAQPGETEDVSAELMCYAFVIVPVDQCGVGLCGRELDGSY